MAGKKSDLPSADRPVASRRGRPPKPVLTEGGLPRVIERYLAGEALRDLAAENVVHVNTVYQWILGGVGDKAHHDVVTAALVNRVAEADRALDEASDPVEIAKRREQCRFFRMDLERRRPGLYGSKQFNVNLNEVKITAGDIGRASELLKLLDKREAVTVESEG